MKFNEASKSPSIVKKAIITFIILNFVLSSIFHFFIISFGSLNAMGGLYTFLLMWCPTIAAIITSFIFFKSIKEFEWKPWENKVSYCRLHNTHNLYYNCLWNILGFRSWSIHREYSS